MRLKFLTWARATGNTVDPVEVALLKKIEGRFSDLARRRFDEPLRHNVAKPVSMAKKKLIPRGTWQATGMQRLRIPKDDPLKLRMRAEELKLKAEGLIREADDLLARTEQIEGARNTNPA